MEVRDKRFTAGEGMYSENMIRKGHVEIPRALSGHAYDTRYQSDDIILDGEERQIREERDRLDSLLALIHKDNSSNNTHQCLQRTMIWVHMA